MVSITQVHELPPEAEILLQKTIEETPACVETIGSIMEAVRTEQGFLWLIHENDKIYGAMFAHFIEAEKRYFNVVTLGGVEMEKWQEELLAFVKRIKKETDSTMIIVTRKGWKKIYPELKEIGSVFIL